MKKNYFNKINALLSVKMHQSTFVSQALLWSAGNGTEALRSGFSIANQIKFDLRFTDLRSTWCSEL